MMENEEHLLEVIENLLRTRDECSSAIFSECGLSDMTVRQIAYLKAIDEHGDITFSRLAMITNTAKPTVTEMVNRFVRMDCVYREPCRDDGRIQYIRLTDKGKLIARAEEHALRRVIEQMMASLDEHERDLLLAILQKVR
jgi:DNA-binding MarR family transcriptional regulator